MQNRTLGTDLSVSAVGLGCMGFSHGYGLPTEAGETETLLRRAFGCLLENAARYSPDGGRISVTLRQAQKALLTVENDCEPIPEEELSRLFEMFYRGDKARSRAGGHGLGLAITRKILALHPDGPSCQRDPGGPGPGPGAGPGGAVHQVRPDL